MGLADVQPKPVDWDNLPVAPWERLPGESARAFNAWEAYRDQPKGERSYRVACERLGMSMSGVREHSIRWHWQHRISLWDKYCADIALKAQLDAVRSANTALIKTSVTIMENALLRITGREPDPETGKGGVKALPIESLSAGDVMKMLEGSQKIMRLALADELEFEGVKVHQTEEKEITVKLAFDATPQYVSQPAANTYRAEEEIIDVEAREVEPAGLPAADDGGGVAAAGDLEGDGGSGGGEGDALAGG